MKAYVSSTFQDLQACREQTRLALARLGVEDVAMEYYVADSERPLERCRRDAAECNLYIGLFAWRYGYIPPGEDQSITELEYRAAVAAGRPTLIFLLSEDASWPRSSMDRDLNRIEALRGELGRELLCSLFSTPQELATLVTTAVHNQLKAHGKPLPEGTYLDPAEISAYFTRIAQQYGRLDLETLTPAQFEDQLRIELNSVFVEPDVREDLPVLDLPKHLQQWLAAQESLGGIDLPDGLSPEEVSRLKHAYRERPRKKVFDLLSEPGAGRRVVFLGDPGAGKSTLVRYLTLALADPATSAGRPPFADCLPILIELKSYEAARKEQGCATFGEFYGGLARSEGLGLSESRLDRYLSEDGRAVAFFDGLDEIFDSAHRAAVTRQIAAFANQYPKVHVVVTSRIIGYNRNTLADAGFTHATLQDLDTEQIRDFLGGWYALALQDRPADAAQRQDRLMAAIGDSRSIGEMAGNPLLLTILAIIGRHQELPRERWKVYDYAATVLVERWDVNRHLRDERVQLDFVGADDKRELLRRIALLMQAGAGHGGNYLTGEELRREFEKYLSIRFRQDPAQAATIAQAMIRQFRERNFILSRYGGELYGFVHRAFLEFFCAEAYRWQFERDREIDIDYLKVEVFGKHWDDPSWHEVLRLIGGTIRGQWTAQIAIYLADEVNLPWPWHFSEKLPWNIALAAQCLAEGRTVTGLDEAARRVLVRIIQLLEHGILDDDLQSNGLLRDEILPAIASVGPAWPGREIYRCWYLDRGVRLAWASISRLAAQLAVRLFPGDSSLLNALIDLIRGVDDQRLTFTLREMLIGLPPGHPEAVALLLERLGKSARRISPVFVDVLARAAADPDACGLLINYAADRGRSILSRTAVNALGKAASEPNVRALLINRVTYDTDETVRYAAISALARKTDDLDVRVLLIDRATHDASNAIRRIAINSLAHAADEPDIRALLIDRAVHDTDEIVRYAAVTTLGRSTDEPDIRALIVSCATDQNHPAVRRATINFLTQAADGPDTRALLIDRATHDPHEDVRRTALNALPDPTDEPDIHALLINRATHDPHRDVRYAAVSTLARCADDPEIRMLLIDRATQDTGEIIRRVAIDSLDRADEDLDIRALLIDRATHDESSIVRRIATQRLAMIAAGPQIAALSSDRPASGGVLSTFVADWGTVLSGQLADPVASFVVSGVTDEENENWIRQLAVRIASCTAEFEPSTLPHLEGSQGVMFGNVS